MKNITGFIVEVRPKKSKTVEFIFDGGTAILSEKNLFIGYFWQMTDLDLNGEWTKAYVTKISLLDIEKLLFCYDKEAIFDINEVEISIKAKRGPESNNKFLPAEYDKLETWNLIYL